MEAKSHFSAKVYSRKKNKGALQSCMTEEDYSTSSPMKKKKRSHSSSSSSSDDSDFYCNDEDFKCTPSPLTKKSRPKNANPPQNRKKLALPKAPRSVRKNKIAETEKMAANRTEIDVFDSEEDALPCNSRKNLGFEMLVEAAAVHKDRGHPSALFSASSDRTVRSNAKEETKIGESSHETERDNYSIYEDERDNEENENYANESDGLEKTSQPHLPIIFEQNKSDFIASHAKKVRSKLASQRTNSVSESIHSAKSTITINEENDKAPELSPAGSPQTERDSSVGEPNKEPGKYVVTKRKTCGKSVSASLLSKITEKLTTEATGVRRVPLGLTGTRALLKSNVVSSAENNSSASGCSNVPRSQASSAPHQRVIGLSRRVRPPPLHPYLSKSNK